MRRVLFALFLVAVPLFASGEEPFEIVKFEPGAIAVPRGWRAMEAITRKLLFRTGDGMGNIPPVDETDEPLQVGMAVEKFADVKEPLGDGMAKLVDGAQSDPRLEWVKKDITTIRLSDGTEAMLLKAEFLKEKTRRSLQMKLIAKDASSTLWIASAHIVGGKDSEWPKASSTMAQWLEAHLTSLVLDEKKLDAKKVRAAWGGE